MLVVFEWPRAWGDLMILLLCDSHDEILDHGQVLIKDVENNLLRHHATQCLVPAA